MSIEKPKTKSQQIKIEFNEESASVEYSNFVVVTHSPAEFILDFIKVIPGIPKADVKSRLIMSPMHTKNLLRNSDRNSINLMGWFIMRVC